MRDADAFVQQHAAGRAGQHHHAVRQQDGFVQVVRDHDDRLAQLAPDLHQFAVQVRLGVGIQCAERLVQQQDAGLDGKAHQERHAPAHAARQLVREGVGKGAQVAQFQQFGHAAVDLVGGHALELQAQRHVLLDAEPGQQGVFLEDVAQRGRHLTVHHLAVHADGAAVDAFQAVQRAQQGAFAGAGRPDHHHDFAPVQLAIDAVQRPMRRLAVAREGLGDCLDIK
ncbi:hypothetical protein G6F65_019665 [Rhizopus arrhizus]|nr:hypothetical protein G6F65_019665 [Rhizopus arrhizus]